MIVRARHTADRVLLAWAVLLAVPFRLAGRTYPAGTILVDEGAVRVPYAPAAFADHYQVLQPHPGCETPGREPAAGNRHRPDVGRPVSRSAA